MKPISHGATPPPFTTLSFVIFKLRLSRPATSLRLQVVCCLGLTAVLALPAPQSAPALPVQFQLVDLAGPVQQARHAGGPTPLGPGQPTLLAAGSRTEEVLQLAGRARRAAGEEVEEGGEPEPEGEPEPKPGED